MKRAGETEEKEDFVKKIKHELSVFSSSERVTIELSDTEEVDVNTSLEEDKHDDTLQESTPNVENSDKEHESDALEAPAKNQSVDPSANEDNSNSDSESVEQQAVEDEEDELEDSDSEEAKVFAPALNRQSSDISMGDPVSNETEEGNEEPENLDQEGNTEKPKLENTVNDKELEVEDQNSNKPQDDDNMDLDKEQETSDTKNTDVNKTQNVNSEPILIDDDEGDYANGTKDQVKDAPTTSEKKSPTKSMVMMTVKQRPVRQSRSKVATYNDILNSINPSLFENNFQSEGDDDIDVNSVSDYHYTLSKNKHTHTHSYMANSRNQSKIDQIYRKPLGKRRFLKTGFVYDTVMSYHATPDPMEIHPEDPSRIFRIFNIIERHKLLSECKRIKSRRATKEEILLAHSIAHYRGLRNTTDLKTRAEYMAMELEYDSLFLNSNSFESALYAVGSLINLLEAVVKDEVKNAFAIIRPPGHHAEVDVPMGFCLFNNVAIATKDCMRRLGVKKTLILDWDIHFGNGTQNIFSEDPNVLYISIHRFEDAAFYPSDMKGAATYTGYGEGEGTTVNVPWPCSGMTDADYVHAFREVVMPIATEFDPDVVIVSAGFDAALNDPIGKCNVTPAGYGQMTYMLKSLANGKLVIALEGGYNLESIAVSALSCMNVLLGEAPEPIEHGLVPKKECFDTIEAVKNVQRKYWKCFN